ncbi:TPA: type-F conjugative transfer system secretin TraK, partial [Klebsiella pneumoniae]
MSASLISGYVSADSITVNSFATISTGVSNNNPNSITVPDDRITSLQSTQGVLTAREATANGSVVFSTLATKPFTMFVQTESGFSFTVNATPRKQQGMSLVVNNKEVKGTEDATTWEGSQNTYSALITGLISRFINNDKPQGFVFSKNTDVQLSPSVQSYFNVRPVTAWRGDKLRIIRLELTSRSSSRLELNER